jgi:hypothetical protein
VTGTLSVLRGTINDTSNGGNPIAAAEYYLDVPPWAGGAPASMEASDGVFDQVRENVQASLVAGDLGLGRHIVFVRGQDNTGKWGPVSAIFFTVDSLITGVVTNAANGSPLPGAQVALQNNQITLHAQADTQGNYSALVISGTYTATVSALAYSPVVIGGIVATTNMTTTQDFSLSPIPFPIFLPLVQAGGS